MIYKRKQNKIKYSKRIGKIEKKGNFNGTNINEKNEKLKNEIPASIGLCLRLPHLRHFQ